MSQKGLWCILLTIACTSTGLLLHQSLDTRSLTIRRAAFSTQKHSKTTQEQLTEIIEQVRHNEFDKSAAAILSKHTDVEPGGHWVPRMRGERHYTIAIIVAYRDRRRHLDTFLYYIHTFLKHQRVEYAVYVSEQLQPENVFNRATAFNVGYKEAVRDKQWDCYVFHDVDVLPENVSNTYRCRDAPVHLGHYLSKYEFTALYEQFFGGVVALTQRQMQRVNGFSNHFWGWGGEDDDMLRRVFVARFSKIYRQNRRVGKYLSMYHPRTDLRSDQRSQAFGFQWHSEAWYRADGLSSLRYHLHRRQREPLYTWLLASYHRTDMDRQREKLLKAAQTKDPRLRKIQSRDIKIQYLH